MDDEDGLRALFGAPEPAARAASREPGAAAALAKIRRDMFAVPVDPVHLGTLTILRRLGAGGMGTVFAAYDPKLDRRVAVKVLHQRSERAQARALREGRALAKVAHENIVVVHGVEEIEGRIHIIMEYVDGGTLRDWVAQPRPWQQIVRAYVAAGRGLHAAHQAGLVHGDFKPDNVLVDQDGARPRVADFGLALTDEHISTDADGGECSVTRGGGTAAYASPEQLHGAPLDARSDQFSFCVSLFEALFGARPFTVDELRGTTLPTPAPQSSALPMAVKRALAIGLGGAVADRHASMEPLLAQLRAAADPPRVRKIGALAGVVGVGGGVLLAAQLGVGNVTQAAPEPCPDQQARVQAAWNRSEIRDGMSHWDDAALRDNVLARADGWVTAWHEVQTEACRAANVDGTTSAHHYQLQSACLDRGLASLHAVGEVLHRVAAQDAIDVVQVLRAPSGCRDPQRLSRIEPDWTDAAATAQRTALHEGFAKLAALSAAGDFEQGEALAESLVKDAERTGESALRAEAMLHLGMVLSRLRRGADAMRTLEEAIWLAEASGHVTVAAEGWIELSEVLTGEGDQARAARALRRAEAAVQRTGDRVHGVFIIAARAMLAKQSGSFEDAITHYEAALAGAAEVWGAEDMVVGQLHINMAPVLTAIGKTQEAVVHAELGAKIYEAATSPTHMRLAEVLNVLGALQFSAGHFAAASQSLGRGLAIAEGTLPPTDVLRGSLVGNLAHADWRAGRLAQARRGFETALEIWTGAHGPEHPDVAIARHNLGGVANDAGDLAGAITHYRAALRILEGSVGTHTVAAANSQYSLGQALIKHGEPEAGVALLAKSLATRQALGVDPLALAQSQINLAIGLQALGKPRAAIEHARAADTILRGIDPQRTTEEREVVGTWLAEHAPGFQTP